MDFNVNDVVKKYIELRDAREVETKAFSATMAEKYGSPMETIEKWILSFLESNGIDNIKTPSGTPYKAVTKSVKMADPQAFKEFVFKPVIDALNSWAATTGAAVPDIMSLLHQGALWDMIDFRAGKKGVVEYAEETGAIPPGVTLDQFTTLNIRRT
jgi:hypothetical protein